MKRAILGFGGLALLVSLSLSLSAQTPPGSKPPAATGLIVGQVIDGTTGRPIADATVYADTPENGVASTSDGRFVLRGVKAGRMFVAAIKGGYLSGVYGQTRANGIRRFENFAEGEKRADVVIKLWRCASIAGRVVDEAGEPVVGIDVRAARRVIRGGEWRFEGLSSLSSDVSAETDDRGEYRFSDLEPGNWLVAVMSTTTTIPTSVSELYVALAGDSAQRPAYAALGSAMSQISAPRTLPGTPSVEAAGDLLRRLTASPGPSRSGDSIFVYPSQYYAAASAPGRAQLVALTPGQERADVDFALRPVRSVRVSGVVESPAGPVANLPLQLVPSDAGDIDGDVVVSATMSDAGGRFTFLGVVPGNYSIRAIQVPVGSMVETQVGAVTRLERAALPADAPTYWARQELTVANSDISNTVVTLSRGFRFGGRVEFEGLPAGQFPTDFRGGQLRIEAADGKALEVGYPNESITLATAQFLSIEFPPGRYFVRTPGYAWGLVSAMSGGRDVSEAPVNLADRNVTDLVVTFSKEPKILRGMVRRGAGEPVTDAVVLAFPTDRQSWTGTGLSSRRFRSVRASVTGSYDLNNLPPGDYFLVALGEDPGEEWRDPQFLARWSADAARVTVGNGSTAGPDLRVRQPGGGQEIELGSTGGPFVSDEMPTFDQTRDAAPPLAATGRISGVVLTPNGTTTSPLRRAIVTLTCANPRVGRTFVTDDTGTFAFDALPKCRYTLISTKSAYLTTRYGASAFDRPATPIDLADGQSFSVRLTMLRGGVITGVIRDGKGEPITNAAVQIMRFQYSRGERRLESVADSLRRTDSNGAYRVYGLPPGEFVVAATATLGGSRSLIQLTSADVQTALQEVRSNSASRPIQPPASTTVNLPPVAGYAPTFYPRTPDPTRATLVKVEAGEERRGVDIALDFVRMSRVSLIVTGTDGQPPATTQARLATPLNVGGFMSPVSVTMPTTVSGGQLSLPPVPPGQYTIAVSGSPQTMPPAAGGGNFGLVFGDTATIAFPQWAIVPVTLNGEDVEIHVQLERGKTVTGRVILNGANPPQDFTGMKMGLAGPTQAGVALNSPARQVGTDGAFAMENVIPAKYRIVNSPIRGWTIASVMVNGQDVADRAVDIATDLSDVVVTFTDKTTDFSGTLQTAAGQSAPDHYVIVFPADRSYWIYGSRRIASLRPGTDGRFTTTTLPAGEYLVAAVTDVANEEWFNPEFLAVLEPAAVRVTIKLGEKTVQDLRIR